MQKKVIGKQPSFPVCRIPCLRKGFTLATGFCSFDNRRIFAASDLLIGPPELRDDVLKEVIKELSKDQLFTALLQK